VVPLIGFHISTFNFRTNWDHALALQNTFNFLHRHKQCLPCCGFCVRDNAMQVKCRVSLYNRSTQISFSFAINARKW
jgi:hypothetical protein